MAQTFVQLPDDAANTGKKEDHFATSGTGNLREAVAVADPSTDAAVAKVQNATPGASDYGLTVRDPATAALAGQTADYDTSGGTATTPMAGIALPASGGPVGVSSSNPLPVTTILSGIAPAAATVGATSAQAVAANASRKAADLINTDDTRVIYLGFGANAAVVGSGIALFPGASVRIQTTQAVNAIASSAGGANLAVQEWQ